MNAKIRYLRRQLRKAEAELQQATLSRRGRRKIARRPPFPGSDLSREEQVQLLKTDVGAWNVWYGEEEAPAANLRGAILVGADLQGADLQGADLEKANLRRADLRDAYLYEAILVGADLRGADLEGADLYKAVYSGETKFPSGFDPEAAGMIVEPF